MTSTKSVGYEMTIHRKSKPYGIRVSLASLPPVGPHSFELQYSLDERVDFLVLAATLEGYFTATQPPSLSFLNHPMEHACCQQIAHDLLRYGLSRLHHVNITAVRKEKALCMPFTSSSE